jgi:VWFA-related protein
MSRRLGLAFLCLSVALPPLRGERVAHAQGQHTPPTFAAGVELITVDAVVLDKAGHPVSGLTRDDFIVKEDGRPQDIASFEAFDLGGTPAEQAWPGVLATNEPFGRGGGRAFLLLLDDLGMDPAQGAAARGAGTSLLERLRGGDEVTVGTTSGELWWSARLPEGQKDVLAVLSRVVGKNVEPPSADRMTEYEAYRIVRFDAGSDSLLPGQSQAPAGGMRANSPPAAPVVGNSAKERVKKRWREALVCQDPNCDGLVRGRASEINSRRETRTRLALQAIRRGLDALSLVPGRKSLLLLSPGFLQDPGTDLSAVTAASREANAAVYFLDARGLVALADFASAANRGGPPDSENLGAMNFEENVLASAGAEGLADDTGGFAARSTNDLAAAAERVADETSVYYLLGFYPPAGKGAREWRKLQVDVKRPGLNVRARRGYALKAAAASPSKPGKEGRKPRLDASVERALDSAHSATGIPLRAMAYVLEPRPKETAHVLVAVELEASRLASPGEKEKRRLDFSVVTTHRDSGREFRSDGTLEFAGGGSDAPAWRALVRDFDLPRGVSQARVVVRDQASAALGSVSYRFEVPAPGALRLSTPILTDHVEAAEAGGSPRPALAVHRTFGPGGNVYCQFEVFGAARSGQEAPRVAAGLELRGPGGHLVRKAAPSPIVPGADGRVVRLLGIGLDGMESGPYELVLEIQDAVSGGHIERREPFAVAAAPSTP